jgi:hypothetical protein
MSPDNFRSALQAGETAPNRENQRAAFFCKQ